MQLITLCLYEQFYKNTRLVLLKI